MYSDFDYTRLDNIISTATTSTKGRGKTRRTYLGIAVGYDIETSSFMKGDEKQAIPYTHTVGIMSPVTNEIVTFMFRFNDDIIKFFNGLSKYCHEKRDDFDRLCVYIHNAAYDLGFMQTYFSFNDIFANGDIRKIMYAVSDNTLEFRCSYMLSGKSLREISKDTESDKTHYDYELQRNPLTPLSQEELIYIEGDVKVLCEYICSLINQENGIANIPFTKTGFVRRRFRRNCLKSKDYQNMIKDLMLDLDEYYAWRQAFGGGYTHANAFYSGKVVEDVDSYDLTSAYPSVYFNTFPMSSGQYIEIDNNKEAFEFMKKFHCLMFIELTNIETRYPFPWISVSNTIAHNGEMIEDNGRIQACEGSIYIACNEIDLECIFKVYNIGSYKIHSMYIYKKDYLPKEFLDVVIDMYKDKTSLKGLKGVNPETGRDVELDYQSAKGDFNASYGMMVQDPLTDEYILTYNDEFDCNKLEKVTYEDKQEERDNDYVRLNNYNTSKTRFLFYPWGCYVTSYVRRILLGAMLECTSINEDPTSDDFGKVTDDWVYSDTDSVKILNRQKHAKYFEDVNQSLYTVYDKVCKKYGYTISQFEPEDKDGEKHLLGAWDYEGSKGYQYSYRRFKTLGAKRYMVEKWNKKKNDFDFEITVSGIKKHGELDVEQTEKLGYNVYDYGAIDYIMEHGGFKFFSDEMEIPAGLSGRVVHTFIDHIMEGDHTDYLGNVYHYKQNTGIHLSTAPYSLSITQKYKDMMSLAKEWR